MVLRRRRTARRRRRPGTAGTGRYFRIEVRSGKGYATYRIQDVGSGGHTKRLAAMTPSGQWVTKTWLIDKRDAHVKNGGLVIDRPKARTVLRQIVGPIRHLKGDIFRARPRRNIPERAKRTSAMRRAQQRNTKKAQAARRRKRRR